MQNLTPTSRHLYLHNNHMETHEEYKESAARRFMATLFTLRAKRYLHTLATAYGWTPEQLFEYEQQFIVDNVARFVPTWSH